MKWIAALLMIVNVAVYLWASGQQVIVNDPAIISEPDVNTEGMLLLNENGNLKQFGNIDSYPPSASRLNNNTDSTARANERANEPAKTKLAQSCYLLGPFKKEEYWHAAKQWMEQNGIKFQSVSNKSRELRAWRVYLGPYSSVSATEPDVQRLQDKNLEYFVALDETESPRISLGYFTEQALATKFLTHLQSIDIPAKSQLEYRQLGPLNWTIITVDSVQQNRAANHDWVENAVGLSPVDC